MDASAQEKKIDGLITLAVSKGFKLYRCTFGNDEGGCGMTAIVADKLSENGWEKSALRLASEEMGWTMEETWAFVWGWDGVEHPVRHVYPHICAMGERLATKHIGPKYPSYL